MSEHIYSVGIDIGTSTTQVVFSLLTLENVAGAAMVPRIKIVKKKIMYQSLLYFTPLKSAVEIDAVKVRDIVEQEFENAGMFPQDISTGAVIITGETARKKNADTVVHALAGLAGKFVVATAGPDLESVLAGRGAGADYLSREKGMKIVNIDIGGGTANISVFDEGKVTDTACFDIGGRLIRFDKKGRVTYIAPKIKKLSADEGLLLEVGKIVSDQDLDRMAERMVGILEEAVGLSPESNWMKYMATNHCLRDRKLDNAIFTFSGGVADCIYFSDRFFRRQFGDIGTNLGKAIKDSKFFKQYRTIRPLETIRATVVGAGNHSMELSGSTITYTESDFPIMNIPVIKIQLETEEDLPNVESQIKSQMTVLKDGNEVGDFAIAIKGIPYPDYEQVEQIADVFFVLYRQRLKEGSGLLLLWRRISARHWGFL